MYIKIWFEKYQFITNIFKQTELTGELIFKTQTYGVYKDLTLHVYIVQNRGFP